METNFAVLIIDDSPLRAVWVTQALQAQGYAIAGVCTSLDDLHCTLRHTSADVILIDLNSPSRDVLEGIAMMSIYNPKPIALLTAQNQPGMLQEALRAGVSAYVVDGLLPHRVASILEVAVARFLQHQKLEQELQKLKSQLEDRKAIEKAKGLMMQKQNLSESEAYHKLRKLAMDKQQTIGEMARSLLKQA